MDWLARIFPNVVTMPEDFLIATGQTLYMVLVTAIISGILGLIIGITLVVTAPGKLLENHLVYNLLDKLVNLFRSIPFVILLAIISPLTRLIVGTSIGTTAAIVPLIIGVIPFYARQVQNVLLDVDGGIIEAAQSVGASPMSIILHVYLHESTAELIRASVVTLISVINLTAMAGAIGGGGLGNLAIIIGYDRFENDVIFVALLIILAMVFLIQLIGDKLAKAVDHS